MGRSTSDRLAAVAALLVLIPPRPAAGQEANRFGAFYEGLRAAAPDAARGAAIQNLMIMREGATILLERGQMHLLEPIEGRTIGAVWSGEGRFVMSAPTAIETAQLRRFYGADRLDQPIRRAVFFFTGDPAAVFPGVTWAPLAPPSDARREVEEAMRYLSDDDGWLDRDLAVPVIDSVPGFFYAHVADGRGDPLMFVVTPLATENVSLSRRADRGREPVVQFAGRQVADRSAQEEEALDPIRISHYDFSSTVESNLDFEARATLTFERAAPALDWIPLRLYPELQVDSVVWDDGTPAAFARPDDSYDLWVDFGASPSSTALTVFYQGDLLDRIEGAWVEVKSSTAWLPQYAAGRAATYRMTFRHHARYRIAAVGTKVSETDPDRDDMITAVWETPEVRWATFNLGSFSEYTLGDPETFQLTVQVDEGAHRALSRAFSALNDFRGWSCPTCRIVPRRQSGMAEEVARDLVNSFAFFERAFGPTETKRFTATEIPYSHGEAHTGLVLLAWSTFHWTTEEGYDEIFRAHEVAHQWWGIGVRPATYHDRWLSEGFAQFSGLWYMGQTRASIELLTDHLATTRDEIWDRRNEAGPIWLGTRAGTYDDPGDYELAVYDKGAWVLHMIRRLLTDPDTGNDDAFEEMIRDFYSTYRGSAATTEQFMEVVSKHAGIPMDWFFRQWVYGTAIPEYRFSYRTEELPNDEVRMTVRVRQLGVPDDFQMIVPVYLDFGLDGSAQVNLVVSGPETVVELPILPQEPSEVVFNAFESVLARVGTERWRD